MKKTIIFSFCSMCGKERKSELEEYEYTCIICESKYKERGCVCLFCGNLKYLKDPDDDSFCRHTYAKESVNETCEYKNAGLHWAKVCSQRKNDTSMINYYEACMAADVFSRHYHG